MSEQLNIILAVQTADANRKLNNAAAAVDNVSNSINQAGNKAKQMGNQFNKTGVALNKFGKGVAQQAGYQFADFAVQVGNGTSAIQAFGQQGSQLLAIFGPIGSILGAGVAILAAIGVAAEKSGSSFFGLADAFKTSKDIANDLEESLTELSKTYDTKVVSSVNAAIKVFGDLTPEMKQLINLNRKLAETKAFKSIASQLSSFKGKFFSTQDAKAAQDYALSISEVDKKAGNYQGTIDAAAKLHQRNLAISKRENVDLMARISAFQALETAINKASKQTKFTSEDLQQLNKVVSGVAGNLSEETQIIAFDFIKAIATLSKQLPEALQVDEETDNLKKSFNEITASIRQQTIELGIQNNMYGKSNAEIFRATELNKLNRAIQTSNNSLTKDDIKNRKDAIEQHFKELKLSEEKLRLEKERQKAVAFIDKQVSDFAKLLESIDQQTKLARERNELFGQSNDLIETELMFRRELEKLTKDGNKLTLEEIDAVRARIDELLREKEILTERQEILKSQQEMEKELDKARQEANKRMEEEQKRINDLMAEGFRDVSDAISGLIDKTSSWRDVLSAVLKKVIDIASKMGTTKSGGFSFDKLFSAGASLFGNLFGRTPTVVPQAGPMVGGVQTFHNGGMIGSGSGVGFRSDERMIVARTGERVLNRGQAMMSQQGGGAVVVNQTINISTGVQQTVRAEIMSMAPQIAAQAKAAVLDAKRRGGGFSAAFA